jgi:hypothetical protein
MDGAQNFIRNGRAQSDLDMNHFKLLNLDTSNLPPIGIPPTIVPPENEWLHAWNAELQEWTSTRPSFTHLSGQLTSDQQQHIGEVGVVRSGTWQATRLDPQYVPVLDLIQAPQQCQSQQQADH